jgi:nitrate reductase NapE component
MPPNKGERIDLYAKGIGGAKVGEALTFLKIVFSVFRALSLLFIIIIVGLLIWQLLMIYFSDTSSANVSTIGTMSFALLGVTL